MWVNCCDPLDLKRELCKECPHFANCSSITTEAIQEVFEEKAENNIQFNWRRNIDNWDDL